MNLAELRKKAQREKQEDAAPLVAPLRELDPVDDAPLPGVLEPHADALVIAPPQGEPEAEPVSAAAAATVVKVPVTFDPLAILMAGREAALSDDPAFTGSEADAGAERADFREFLCFKVSSEIYAIDIMDIKEIIKPREVTEVPRAPAFVSGVLSLRGIIIPVFDMRLRLGLAGGEKSAKERIIVLKKSEEFFGVLVDEVIQVVRIAAATIEKPPAVLDGIDRDFVSGIGRFDGQMLILLNQEKILDLTLA